MSGGARKETGAGKKFQTYNINDTYKGGRPETRAGANAKGHGMTSLGKIQSRRMPGPSSLPSLRTENAGNDPDINLVPSNSGGWGGGGGGGGGGAGGGGKEREEKEAPPREPPPKWGATGEHDESGSALPQHLQGEFPTLRDHQQHEGGRRDRPLEGPPTGWGGGGPDGKQQTRGGPPHRGGYYPEGAQWGDPYGGPPPPGQMRGHPGPYGPPPPGPHSHHPRGRGPPREGSARGAYPHMYRPYPSQRPRQPYSQRREPSRQVHGETAQDVNRPCLVKEDELKNLEVSVDEDDGGWAGHHAEVDYSKEVVFDDSDEELGEERERSSTSHTAWTRMEDEGRLRHKHPAAMLQEADGREVMRRQHPQPSEEHPQYHIEEGHHYPPYEQKQAKGGRYGGRDSHQGAWGWQDPPRRAWDRPPEAPRFNVGTDEGDWRQSTGSEQLMQGHVDRLRQRSESASSREDLERSDDFGAEAPPHAREPVKSRQQLRIMMREITDSPSPESQVKDVAVTQAAETKPPQGWSVTAQQPPPHQKAKSPVSAKEAPIEEDEAHSPADSIATARAAASVATKTAWNASNRGPVSTGRRLYEPEGQASAKKFHMYKRIHDKDHTVQDKKSGNGSETADTPTTPGMEGKIALLKGDKDTPSDGEDSTSVQKSEGAQVFDGTAEVEGAKSQRRESAGNQKTQHGKGRTSSRGGEETRSNAKQPGEGARQPRGDSRRPRDSKQQHDSSRSTAANNRQPSSSIKDPKDAGQQGGNKRTSDGLRSQHEEFRHGSSYPDEESKSRHGDMQQSLNDNKVAHDPRPPIGDSRQPRSDANHLHASQQTQDSLKKAHSDSKQHRGDSRQQPHSHYRQPQGDIGQPQGDSKQPHSDTRRPQGDTRRSHGDSKGPHSDSRRPQGDARQPQGDSRGPQSDARQPQGDSRGPQSDTRQPQGDSGQPQGGSRGPQGGSRGPQPESRRAQDDSRGPQGESKRAQGDSRGPQGDTRQPQGGSRGPQGESRRAQGDSRRRQGDSRRPHGDSRQPQGDARQPQGDARQPQGDPRQPQGDSRVPGGDGLPQNSLQQSYGDTRPLHDDQRQSRGDNSRATRGRRERGRRDDPRKSQEAWKHDQSNKESPAPEGRPTTEQRKEGSQSKVSSEGSDIVNPVAREESQSASGQERPDPHTQHPKEPRARPQQKDDPSRGPRGSRDYHQQRPKERRERRHENRHGREHPHQEAEWDSEPKGSPRRGARQAERRPAPAAKQEGGRPVQPAQSRGKPREHPAATDKHVHQQESQPINPALSETETAPVENLRQDYQQSGKGARNNSARSGGQRVDQDGSKTWPGSREGRQREPRKPGSGTATDNRPPRREGGARERSRKEPRQTDAPQQQWPAARQQEVTPDVAKEPVGTEEPQEVPVTDPAASVAQLYDLNSHQVFVVDQTEGPDILLSPVDDSDFTEVVSKREKRDKKEKKEVPKRVEDSASSQQRTGRKGGIHGTREEVPSFRSQVKQGGQPPPGSRGRGRNIVDGARVPGPRAPGAGAQTQGASQWEASYSKSVSGAQLSSSHVFPGAELNTTPTPLSVGQVHPTLTPSPGVIGSGIPSPTAQNAPSYMFVGVHPLLEGERLADSGGYSLFSGLSGDVLHNFIPVSRSDVAQGHEQRTPSAPPPSAPGRILGKALQDIQDTIAQEHPSKAGQQPSSSKQQQMQQGDGRLVVQPQAAGSFSEKGCASELQSQPQQSSSEKPQRHVQQEGGRSVPGRGRGVAAGRLSGARAQAPRHHTGGRGSDRGTAEGRGSGPVAFLESRPSQMPGPNLSVQTTGRDVQASSGSGQTGGSQDKPAPPHSVTEETSRLPASLPSNRDSSVAENFNTGHTGPSTTQRGGQMDGARETNRSTAPEDGAGNVERDVEGSQGAGSVGVVGKLSPELVSSGGFFSYASAVKSSSRPSSAASTGSIEGQKHSQLELNAPTYQEINPGQGAEQKAGGRELGRVEMDTVPSEAGVVEDDGMSSRLDFVAMRPALQQPPEVCESGNPSEDAVLLARLSSKPVAHVKPQQPVVKAGAATALDICNTFSSSAGDVPDMPQPVVEALQAAPQMGQHQPHPVATQHGDFPLAAPELPLTLEPTLGDVAVIASAAPDGYATESSTEPTEASRYQMSVDHSALTGQVQSAGPLSAHLPSSIPVYMSPTDRVLSVSSLPECEQATVEGHGEPVKSHEEFLQAAEDREDSDLVSKQLRVSAVPFVPNETLVRGNEDQVTTSVGGEQEQPVAAVIPQTSIAGQVPFSVADAIQVPPVSLLSVHPGQSAVLAQQQKLHSAEPSHSVHVALPTPHATALGISHPHPLQSHPHLMQPHPQSLQQHPHSIQSHPQSVQPAPHSVQPHPHPVRPNPHSMPPNPHSMQPHPHSVQPHPQQTMVQLQYQNMMANHLAAMSRYGYFQGMVPPTPRAPPHTPPLAVLYGAASNPQQPLNMANPALVQLQIQQQLALHTMLLQQQAKKAKEEGGAAFLPTPPVDPSLTAKMRSGGQNVPPGRTVVLPPGYPVAIGSGAEGHQVTASLSRKAPAVQQQPIVHASQSGSTFGSPRPHGHSRPAQKQPRSPLLPTPAVVQSSVWPPPAQPLQQHPQQTVQPPSIQHQMEPPVPSDTEAHTTTS